MFDYRFEFLSRTSGVTPYLVRSTALIDALRSANEAALHFAADATVVLTNRTPK